MGKTQLLMIIQLSMNEGVNLYADNLLMIKRNKDRLNVMIHPMGFSEKK